MNVIASSTVLTTSLIAQVGAGVYDILTLVMPFLLGFALIYLGYRWVRRAARGGS